MSFVNELESLINRHSMENGSDTPDYILAAYLKRCLDAFDDAVRARTFHARKGSLEELTKLSQEMGLYDTPKP